MPKTGRVGHEGEALCRLSDEIVAVRSAYGNKSARLGHLSPEWLARQLLSEMIGGGPGQVRGVPRSDGAA